MGIEKNIPEDWGETTLGETTYFVSDKINTEELTINNYISTENLLSDKKGIVASSTLPNVSKVNSFKKEDVLFSNIRTYFKKVWFASKDGGSSNDVLIFRPVKEDSLNKHFLYRIISSDVFIDYTVKTAKGTKMPRGDKNAIKLFPINLPPLSEQKAIAKVLTTFDDKIELLQAQNKTLETMAQTIFKEWFGKYQIEDELPEGWRVGKLGNEFDITIGRTPPRKETQWFSDRPTGKKWISIKDIGNCGTFIYNTSEYLTDEAIEKFNIPIIPTNTTILSFKMTVGKLTITTEDMLSNEAIAHLKIKNDSTLTSEFIYLFLRDLNFNSLGSTSSIVTAINSTIIKGIDFIIPKDELMNSFQKKILPIFKKIQNNSSQIQSLTKTRDTLLPKLMSGQFRVNNLNEKSNIVSGDLIEGAEGTIPNNIVDDGPKINLF